LKNIINTLAFAAIVTLIGSSTVVADPITFNFVTPDWTVSTNPSVYGTGLDLSITVDNGFSNFTSQAYNFSQITGITATAIGGTYAFSVPPAAYSGPSFVDADTAPITTDASGVPTLDLTPQIDSAYWVAVAADGETTLQIGIIQMYSGVYPIYVSTGENPQNTQNHAYYEPYVQDPVGHYIPGRIVGVVESTVPEPSTLSLLMLALVPLGLNYRKSRKPA
jgi:hypothetical protein